MANTPALSVKALFAEREARRRRGRIRALPLAFNGAAFYP